MRKTYAPTGYVEPRTELGRFVRERRLRLGLTQAAVDALIGEKQYISRIEVGTSHHLRKSVRQPLADALQCHIDELNARAKKGKPIIPNHEFGRLLLRLLGQSNRSLEEFIDTYFHGDASYARNCIRSTKRIRLRTAASYATFFSVPIDTFVPVLAGNKPTQATLGQVIRSYRLKQGLTLQALGGRVGVTREFIRQVEMGISPLYEGYPLAHKLAKVLKIPAEEFSLPKRNKRRVHKIRHNLKYPGGWFVKYRLERKLTRRELATILGVPYQTMGVIEQNRASPDKTFWAAEQIGLPLPEHLRNPLLEKYEDHKRRKMWWLPNEKQPESDVISYVKSLAREDALPKSKFCIQAGISLVTLDRILQGHRCSWNTIHRISVKLGKPIPDGVYVEMVKAWEKY